MSRYEKCPNEVKELASAILTEYESHKPLCDAKVRVDYLFAFPVEDEEGNPTGDAIRYRGQKALGLARIVGLKDRTAGRGDVEVLLDGEWWEEATEEQRKAVLDHELHHFDVRKDADGKFILDDLNRPKLKMRQHDIQVGWFKIVAARHGEASQERIQAKALMDGNQQLLWPDVVKMELAQKAA